MMAAVKDGAPLVGMSSFKDPDEPDHNDPNDNGGPSAMPGWTPPATFQRDLRRKV